MQLVGAYEVFGLLFDLSVLVGRYQLGRYRRVDDVEQRLGSHLTGYIAHEVADEGLGHTGIHAVHRHVVAVIRGPAQSQFREVARAHDDGVLLVGHVHEYLRPLTGL